LVIGPWRKCRARIRKQRTCQQTNRAPAEKTARESPGSASGPNPAIAPCGEVADPVGRAAQECPTSTMSAGEPRRRTAQAKEDEISFPACFQIAAIAAAGHSKSSPGRKAPPLSTDGRGLG
jgi:hypothetical protein